MMKPSSWARTYVIGGILCDCILYHELNECMTAHWGSRLASKGLLHTKQWLRMKHVYGIVVPGMHCMGQVVQCTNTMDILIGKCNDKYYHDVELIEVTVISTRSSRQLHTVARLENVDTLLTPAIQWTTNSFIATTPATLSCQRKTDRLWNWTKQLRMRSVGLLPYLWKEMNWKM